MKLTLSKRKGEKKSELTQIKYEGDIPAILYHAGKAGEKIVVKGSEFHAALREMPKGYLPTKIFELELEGKKCKGIVKDIQYHSTTYQIVHLDFLELKDKEIVELLVPIDWIGEAECVGIKLGGFLRPARRHIKVRCLPKDIPTDFKVDIKDLQMNQIRKVSDIKMEKGVRSLVPGSEIACAIAKR